LPATLTNGQNHIFLIFEKFINFNNHKKADYSNNNTTLAVALLNLN